MRATSMPESESTSMDWTTRTPPEGSVSLARGATRAEPPEGRMAISSSATGAACSSPDTTSTRTTPTTASGPSLTV